MGGYLLRSIFPEDCRRPVEFYSIGTMPEFELMIFRSQGLYALANCATDAYICYIFWYRLMLWTELKVLDYFIPLRK